MNYSKFPFVIICSFLLVICFQSCEPDGGDDIIECGGKGEDNTTGGDDNSTVRKPNIYIYPEENIELLVTIDFPFGGEVIESIPAYRKGWEVSVDANGVINDSCNFLFYESTQPDVWQRKNGWVIQNDELEDFFIANMVLYGFIDVEIDDFIEYWIPRFNSAFYVIYPQISEIINPVIEINFSLQPENFLRLFYVVEGYNSLPGKNVIEPFKNSDFDREGYFVTVWVLLKIKDIN